MRSITVRENIKKVLNLVVSVLFSIALHFIFIFELVRYRNAKQWNWLKFAQRFDENDVFSSYNDFSIFYSFSNPRQTIITKKCSISPYGNVLEFN